MLCSTSPIRPEAMISRARLDGRDVAVVEARRRLHAGALDGRDDLGGLGGVASGRLLDPQVLAGLGRRDGDVAVDEVGAGDAHQVDVVAGDQLAPVGQLVLEAVRRNRPRGAVVGGVVGHGDQPRPQRGVGIVLEEPGQRTGVHLPHPAEPDDADAQLLRH